MKFKRHHCSTSFHTDQELADLEALLTQLAQQPGYIGVLLADHDANLIVSDMPDHIDLASITTTALKAFKDGQPQFITEVSTDEGFVITSDFGGGLLVYLSATSGNDRENNLKC